MKFLDLFSGIGGFRMGMEQAGHTCVGYCEIDKFARQSYNAIFNTKGEWTSRDISTIRATELPYADIWCFGFPCQDISIAGKLGGFTNGKRSSLFFATTRLIRDRPINDRPKILFIENVKNLLSINGGFDFLKAQIELDELGYDVEWSVLDSAELVPQHRERLFIIGHSRTTRQRKVFPITGIYPETTSVIKQINKNTTHQGNRIYDANGIAPTLTTGTGGNHQPKTIVPNNSYLKVRDASKLGFMHAHSGDAISLSYPTSESRRGRVSYNKTHTLLTDCAEGIIESDLRVRKLTPLECWRLQGFPDDAFYKAKASNLSDAQLYKQAGNSVTVPVIRRIAENFEIL